MKRAHHILQDYLASQKLAELGFTREPCPYCHGTGLYDTGYPYAPYNDPPIPCSQCEDGLRWVSPPPPKP